MLLLLLLVLLLLLFVVQHQGQREPGGDGTDAVVPFVAAGVAPARLRRRQRRCRRRSPRRPRRRRRRRRRIGAPDGRDVPQGAASAARDRQGRPGGHQGVPVPVPQPTLELHHGAQGPAQSAGPRSEPLSLSLSLSLSFSFSSWIRRDVLRLTRSTGAPTNALRNGW